MNAPRRIGYVNPFAQEVSGPDESLLLLIRGLDRTRYAPVVYLPGRGRYHDLFVEAGAEVHVVPMYPLRRFTRSLDIARYVLGFPLRTLALRRQFHGDRIDLVHTNMEVVLESSIAGRMLGLPTITHVRGNASARPKPFFDVFFRLLALVSSAIITISESVAELFSGRGIVTGVKVIHNAVDLHEYPPGDTEPVRDALRRELGIPAGALLVGMIGRFHPRKGIELLVDAGAWLADRHPGVEFLLVGEATGDQEQRYITCVRDRILALGLWNRFHIVGARSDVPALMAALDVLVLSSFEEGFGRVIIEAMAQSRPVVATSQGGPREIVEDGGTGYLVSPGDAIALARALDRLLSDPELRRRLGEAGRVRVAERFSLPQHVRLVTGLYDELLEGGHPS